MLRVVIDTSVVVAALRSRHGRSNAVLRAVANMQVIPLATVALFLEYEDVLKRTEQKAVHGLDDKGVEGFLAALASAIEPVNVHFAWRPQLSDPSDEMVLEAGVNGRADAIVTFNVRDFSTAAKQFGVAIWRPAKLLEEMDR